MTAVRGKKRVKAHGRENGRIGPVVFDLTGEIPNYEFPLSFRKKANYSEFQTSPNRLFWTSFVSQKNPLFSSTSFLLLKAIVLGFLGADGFANHRR